MIRFIIITFIYITSIYGSILDEAIAEHKNENIKNAITLYKQSARAGNDEANFKLGTIYYKGEGVRRNFDIAMKYFQKAAAYGHIKSKYNTAVIYSQKRYSKHNYIKAYNIFLELALEDDPASQNKVGLFLTYGLGVDKDYKEAVKWFEKSYFKGDNLEASCNLALMFASGKGVFPNFGRAYEISQEGYKKSIPICVKVNKEFNLHKYQKDKGFKYGFYK
ncbi:MAG: tetratricopeptide repeat protein [Campylobacterota bacterium]|nr:tetratricopeptide repeat protein [Campylobacterota bacterium]